MKKATKKPLKNIPIKVTPKKSNKIFLGDTVTWVCSPRKGKPFTATGKVTGFGTRYAGNKSGLKSVLLSVDKKSKYYKIMRMVSTAVLLSNVSKA